MDASRIAVVQQSDVGREAMEYVYLMNRECRARVCHHILNATLVHRDYIGVTLYHEYTVFLGYSFQRLSNPDSDTQRCAWRHNW